MPIVKVSNNLVIQGADSELKDYLKELLTLLNPEWLDAQTFGRWTGNIPKYISQYEEVDEDVIVPRGIFVHLTQDLGYEFEVQDFRAAPMADKDWPEGNIILRPNDQEPAVQELLQHQCGFLSAPAGSGKTVMGLEAARRLGLKALWLTHRKELKEQAIDRAVELLEIPRQEIGVFHGKTWKQGPQLTVGMIPTLRKRDLSEISEDFGVVIIDEAHHVPSSTFLQVAGQMNAKYLYGLTATAYRRDKLDSIMFHAVGPIISRIEHVELFEDEHLIKPTIRRRPTGWCPKDSVTMEYHDFMEAMVTSKLRNDMIVGDIARECQDPNNTCVVLVERTKHAELLTELLKDRGVDCEFVVGSIDVEDGSGKKKRKKKAIPKDVRNQIVNDFKEGEIQVLVATYDLLAEGFDYRPLNRLFLATPIKWKGTVVQAIGRVQRPCEGKTGAVVYDYVDGDIAMFWKQADSRLHRVYRPMGMPVEDTQ